MDCSVVGGITGVLVCVCGLQDETMDLVSVDDLFGGRGTAKKLPKIDGESCEGTKRMPSELP